ncbi:MAG: helix-turn-helix domain-containing protein [Acidobacteriota bacterium]|jgi:transcriptional regulator with XRE-family HTH domain|nr:helix-turn-helix domain-containing protein [Acidobacteriota bacterium]
MKSLDQMMKKMSPEDKARIETRAREIIAEEMTLRELRKAHRMTQKNLATALNVGQDQISRMEKRSDLLISTLRSYVEAMGGTLTLVAEFPNQKAVILPGISSID